MSNLNEEDIAKITEAIEEAKNKPVEIEIPAPMITSLEHDLSEWTTLITELSLKEIDYIKIKNTIFNKEQGIKDNTDFKKVYGANNADVRKRHLQKFLKEEYDKQDSLEISINYIKRRISFLKQLIHTKTVIMEVKE